MIRIWIQILDHNDLSETTHLICMKFARMFHAGARNILFNFGDVYDDPDMYPDSGSPRFLRNYWSDLYKTCTTQIASKSGTDLDYTWWDLARSVPDYEASGPDLANIYVKHFQLIDQAQIRLGSGFFFFFFFFQWATRSIRWDLGREGRATVKIWSIVARFDRRAVITQINDRSGSDLVWIWQWNILSISITWKMS